MPAARFIVSGALQGVCYRASAREKASHLGLGGYAKKRADGCVEVLAIGDDNVLQALEQGLQRGPPLAKVDFVCLEDTADNSIAERFTIFEVR